MSGGALGRRATYVYAYLAVVLHFVSFRIWREYGACVSFTRPGYVPRPDGVTRKHLPACNASEQHIVEGTEWKERDIQRVNSDPRVSRKSDLRLPYSGQVVAGGFKFVLAVCLQTLDRNARNYRESQRCVREDTPST